jgi:hypothetical protein
MNVYPEPRPCTHPTFTLYPEKVAQTDDQGSVMVARCTKCQMAISVLPRVDVLGKRLEEIKTLVTQLLNH